MSYKNEKWVEIFEGSHLSESIENWLKNEKSPVFQIKNEDFKKMDINPVKVIPSYSKNELPEIFEKYGLTFLRNLSGSCLIIKERDFRLPSLFPELKKPKDEYSGLPFYPIPEISLFNNQNLINEETGIYLAWTMGVIQNFLMELYSPFENYFFGGRLKTNAIGKFKILESEFEVNTQVECDAYFESQKRIIVLEGKRAKNRFPGNFSMHQLILPLLLVQTATEKKTSGLYFDFSMDTLLAQKSIIFRLYHYELKGNEKTIAPFSYKLIKSKKYIINLHKTLNDY